MPGLRHTERHCGSARAQEIAAGIAEFIERDHALPRAAVAGKRTVRGRFQPEPGRTAGPVFGCRIRAGDP